MARFPGAALCRLHRCWIGLLRQWLQQGMPLAPDEMATVVEGIITKGVLALQ